MPAEAGIRLARVLADGPWRDRYFLLARRACLFCLVNYEWGKEGTALCVPAGGQDSDYTFVSWTVPLCPRNLRTALTATHQPINQRRPAGPAILPDATNE